MQFIYFINSISPLTELINLVQRFDNVPPKGQVKLAKRIQGQIDEKNPDLQADLNSFSSRLDKPVSGGVAFRGNDDDGLREQSVTHACQGSGGIAFQKIILIHQ